MNKTAEYTIGCLLPNLVGDYHRKQWTAINRACIDLNVNMIFFSPFMFYSHISYTSDYFKTYKFVDKKNVDGIIASTGSMSVFCELNELEALFRSFEIPVVSIAEHFNGIPSILIDNKQGMYEIAKHFIDFHGYRKIAFIRGPENNQEAELRFSAYKQALEEFNIPLDNRLIVQGDFSLHSGSRAICELLDERDVSLDAILSANDDMILGCFAELNERGIDVPHDIAIAGFDDTETVKDSKPPISSVKQPVEEQGHKAVEILLDIIKGKSVQEKTLLPAIPVIRESCGCKASHPGRKDSNIIEINTPEKTKALENTEKGYHIGNLSVFYTSIMNTLSFDSIYDQFEQLLPGMEIPSSFITFYNRGAPISVNDANFPPEEALNVFAYKDNKRLIIKEDNRQYEILKLIPADVGYFEDRRRSIVISELIFQREHYGFIIFELSYGIDPLVFHLLLLQLTSCLQSIYIHNELEKAFQKLTELDKAKTNFFSNISHEFRTPLTLMLSPLESIIQGDYGKELKSSADIFKAMHRNGLRLSKLINNLLDVTKIEAGKMAAKKQKTDIVKLLTYYTSSIYSGAASLGLSIDFINKANQVTAWIDRDLVEKAFFNLISNALKFTPNGGVITVILDSIDETFSIAVKDTGIGIRKDKIDIIFERFNQADEGISRKFEGTGIGLSFTKEIVKLHNGIIKVESEWGKGSTFTMILPIARKEFEESIEPDEEDLAEVKSYLLSDVQNSVEEMDEHLSEKLDFFEAANDNLSKPNCNDFTDNKEVSINKKHNILICDDNNDMRQFLKSLLDKNYNTVTAKNGKEGLEKAKKSKPTLILSDVMMPEMSGYELCNELKKDPELANIPIILITAKADVSMKIEGLEYGADDYLFKPFNAKELILRVKVFVNREELRKELEEKNLILSRIVKQDGLTGLLHHAAVFEELEIHFKKSREDNTSISIIMIDIDYFKKFNDTYGHQVGDLVILEFARVIRETFRACDIKGRYGGDEFILILPNCGLSEIRELYDRVYRAIKEIRIKVTAQEISVTASIGVAVLEKDIPCDDPNALIELADKALYIVKDSGRDQGCILEFQKS